MYRSMLEAANEIYAEYISSGENIMEVAQKPTLLKLKNVIESIKKEDFGITNNQYANAILFNEKDTISYANIHSEDDERFSFGLFFIPKGGFLPLHDHPNMFVFSKILMGKVKRLSFSLTNRNIQFDYPHQIILQKAYVQQQQLLLQQQQQRQMMAQKQQLQNLQLQKQNHQLASCNNHSIKKNNSNNNIMNVSQANNNQSKNNLEASLPKSQITEPNEQRILQVLNDSIAKDQQQPQIATLQNSQNNQNQTSQRVQNSSPVMANNNNKKDNSPQKNSHNGTGQNGYNGQIISSPNLIEQEQMNGQIDNLRKNSNQNDNEVCLSQEQQIQNQQQQYQLQQLQQHQQQQQLQQQHYQQQQQILLQQQQQQQQLAFKIDKKYPDLSSLNQPQLVEASLDSEEILCEGFIDDLDPFHKNLHYIEAVEDCVFFDVLLPHYDLKKRYCNYYNIYRAPDPTTGKAILSISNQPINQCKVQYFTIEKSTCEYFN